MNQCKQCGKRGLFLSLNADSLCKDCAAKLEAERLERQNRLIAEATAFIEDFAQHAQKAVSKSYVFPSMGVAKIEEIKQECKYIQEHIDDRKRYPGFKVAFLGTLSTDDHGLQCSPIFPGRILSRNFADDLDGNLQKYFNELYTSAKDIYNRAVTASKDAYDYTQTFRVAGVTFRNGRRSRQTILRALKFRDPPYENSVSIAVEKEDYEGEDAVGIYVNKEKVGFISKADLPWVLERWDKCVGAVDYSVYGGLRHSFGLEVTIGFRN